MTADREIQDEELMGVAQDPEQALRLRRSLRTIAGATSLSPDLREMARSVLSGRVDIKDAFQDPRYTEAVYQRMHEIRRAADDQTYAERQQSKARFAEWDARQQADLDRERAERDAPVYGSGKGSRSGQS
ncbi:hypothetical protein IM697_34570 [Streptomyces ferrugineus]|uniref:Uncharacterized protein n=1 Tax=Streptomyces ferrugineus TaxID=1413221 RepID=A0A7M2SGN5_9ACTN|nr:hypothetical protein [Streptomyces ferrugineus]QOV35159.1 hypothetical protein IM697_34570 [Streptomyces ferrugineus]